MAERDIEPVRSVDQTPAANAELPFALEGRRVFVAGHRGMVGSAISRRLAAERCEIETADRQRVDLTRQAETESYLAAIRPDVVIIAAAKVGGNRCQQFSSSRFSARQFGDRAQSDRCLPCCQGEKAVISRLLVHLPEIRRPADQGGRTLDRLA